MRLRLEATPDELRTKQQALLDALAKALSGIPETAELSKGLRGDKPLKYPVLRSLKDRVDTLYAQQLQLMLRDIKAVLDRPQGSMRKAFEDHSKPIYERQREAYETVKGVLRKKGYVAADFEEGGALYGASVNELVKLARKP